MALVGLPQCLAYAMMSGLPPAYGLSTAAVAGLVAAVLGRSAQVVTGPTNTTGLLILGALAPFIGTVGLPAAEGLTVLATLTLLAGLLRIALALVGGTWFVRFLPESVLVGFTAGAGVLIGIMQLDEALGLPAVSGAGLRAELTGVAEAFRGGHGPAAPAVLFAVGTMLCVAAGRRIAARTPSALLAVMAGTLVAWACGLDASTGLPLLADRSPVPNGWPAFALPSLSPALLEQLFVPASAIVLMGTLELVVTSRAGGARVDLRREILAQGWANVAGAFAACFPASASLGRSALLRLSGARTRLAPASAAVFLVPILFLAGPLVGRIPQASLAGVLLVVAFNMLDRPAIRRMWLAARETRVLLGLTWALMLALPVEWAVLFGAGLGLVIHLGRTSAPRLRLFTPVGGRLVPAGETEAPAVVVLEVSGNLHYAAVPPFLDKASRLVPPSARTVVLDLSYAHEIRFSALLALERLAEQLSREGSQLWLAGVGREVRALLQRAESRLPATPAEAEPGLSVRRCLETLAAAQPPRGPVEGE